MERTTFRSVVSLAIFLGFAFCVYSVSRNYITQDIFMKAAKVAAAAPNKLSSAKVSGVIPKYDFKNASQEDPKLIEYIRREIMHPPSPLPYVLQTPKNVHFSQFGQSKYADDTFLHGMKNGFFLEVGAADGEFLSNTLYFERELGWRGLLIEPVPSTYKTQLDRHRKAYSANCALSLTTKATELIIQPAGAVGVMSQLSKKGTTVKALPLYSLILALEVKVIDFLSLDIEAYEVKVLKTLPFDKVKFRLMCIEINHIPEGVPYLTKFMTERGYKFYGIKGIDAWYGLPELLDPLNKTTAKPK